MLALLVLAGLPAGVLAEEEPAGGGVSIRFFSPMRNGSVPDAGGINESSFSVPNPVVVLDPIALGDPVDNPGKTVIQQVGPGT